MNDNIVIELSDLTKDFGEGKGIFNAFLQIKEGEMVGFVGTNGSGKTTTLRAIVGFIKPTRGKAFVLGKESWLHSAENFNSIGYVPGEISFPDLKTGVAFLKSQADFLGFKDFEYANKLISILKLDPRANLKRMSKGMKQKTALVAALMKSAPILIMDEPTTGLDPLMRISFMEVIKEEHRKGKTVLMSSQSFEELEEACDRVIFVLDGHFVDVASMAEIKNRPTQEFKIEFNNKVDYEKFKSSNYEITRDQSQYYQVTIKITKGNVNPLMNDLENYDVKFISEIKYTLERHFKEIVKLKEER